MDKKIQLIADCIETMEKMKEFINNMQTIQDQNMLAVGFRLGILLSEVNLLQQDLQELNGYLQKEIEGEL